MPPHNEIKVEIDLASYCFSSVVSITLRTPMGCPANEICYEFRLQLGVYAGMDMI